MSEPTVSVIVLTYNHQEYIGQCLDAILKQQTSFDFEVIVGEDESSDGTREICIRYAEKYPEVIRLFLRNRKDVIYIGGRATGRYNFIESLKAAKGKYIALCEGDDYWTDNNKLQRQADFLAANIDYSICFHDVQIFHQQKNQFIEDQITPRVESTTDRLDLAKGNYIHTPSVFFVNDFEVPHWFKESPIGDWSLYMIMIGNRKIGKMNGTMAVYRVHNQGIWSTQSQDYRNEKTRESIRLLLKYQNYPKAVHKVLAARSGSGETRKEFRGKYFIKRILKSLRLNK